MENQTVFSRILSDLAAVYDVTLSDHQAQWVKQLYDLNYKWAQKINITKNIEARSFLLENIFDPWLALRAVFPLKASLRANLSDVGCGGGFVGLCWHVFGQNSGELTLIDGDRKKVNFCKQVIRELGVLDAKAEQSRLEELKNPPFEMVVTRATWPAYEAIDRYGKVAAKRSRIYVLQGPSIKEQKLPSQAKIHEYSLKSEGGKRYVVEFQF